MLFLEGVISFLSYNIVVNADVIVWSDANIELFSPLRRFDEFDFYDIVQKLGTQDRIHVFRLTLPDSAKIPENLDTLISKYNSFYNANGRFPMPEQHVHTLKLVNNETFDLDEIERIMLSNKKNAPVFLCAIDIIRVGNERVKREAANETSTDQNKPVSKPEGSVIYIGQNKKDNMYSLLYASEALLFKLNDTEIYLGNTGSDYITVDHRLNVNIPLDDGNKITLRFNFTWQNGYWYLPSVKITDTNNLYSYNLLTNENIYAASKFSYHCNGKTVFTDPENKVELYIYNLQVQTMAQKAKFGDAYDCVSFTTVPIWSGLFVTALLGIGLMVALTAIMDIKTMDKFDNHKTKNLNITVSE